MILQPSMKFHNCVFRAIFERARFKQLAKNSSDGLFLVCICFRDLSASASIFVLVGAAKSSTSRHFIDH